MEVLPENKPDYEHPDYEYMNADWKKAHDFFNGTRAVRDSANKYLTRFSRETEDDYRARIASAELYNVFTGTVSTAVGMVFKSKIVPQSTEEDPLPKPIEDLFPDIDGCGNDLSSFLRETFTNLVRDGHSFILVDAPEAIEKDDDNATITLDNVIDRTPFWINYAANQIINWDFERRGSKDVLTRVIIAENVLTDKGNYGKEMVKQIRELTETGFIIHREKANDEDKNKTVWYVHAEGTRSVDKITLVCIYSSRKTGLFKSIPPYMDLLEMNIVHYNKQSILDTALTYTVPLTVFFVDNEENAKKFTNIVTASNRSLIMWGVNPRVEYLELKGQTVPELRTDLTNREMRMAKMGIEKFAPVEDGTNKTAFEVGSDNRRSMSEIGIMAKNLEDGVEMAFYYTALYFNAIQRKDTVDADNLKVKLQMDYDRLTFSTEQIRLFKDLADGGYLSKLTLLELLPTIAELPEDFDAKEELERIKDEMPKADVVNVTNNVKADDKQPIKAIE